MSEEVKYKQIKDPIYGYINIPEHLIKNVIDTAEFQRLRYIIQTSYASLYPSTLHNRFVHSLGVYHLGCMAVKSIIERNNDVENMYIDALNSYAEVFKLACLLHDVGHAPFSHTGERFYLKGGSRKELHNEIIDLTGDEILKKEIEKNDYEAAPHELMSVIVALENFRESINSGLEGFFARCITGYKYVEKCNRDLQIRNCFIELLNSKILDVDKIDYLIRDSYMSGFNSAVIDYERLLSKVAIRMDGDTELYTICFEKSALSIIESVVYAHDLEKKWIQSHPSVAYESYLIQKTFEIIIEEKFKVDGILPKEILKKDGLGISGYGKIKLACDGDMIYLMKNTNHKSKSVDEYFDRRARKHTIWKNESEYRALFDGQEESAIKEIKNSIKELGESKTNGIVEINEQLLSSISADIENVQKRMQENDEGIIDYKEYLKMKKAQENMVNIFKTYSEEANIKFDFVVIFANQFDSSFKKPEFEKIKIHFSNLKGLYDFGKISNVLKASNTDKDDFFYIYREKPNDDESKAKEKFMKQMIEFAENRAKEKRLMVIGDKLI